MLFPENSCLTESGSDAETARMLLVYTHPDVLCFVIVPLSFDSKYAGLQLFAS